MAWIYEQLEELAGAFEKIGDSAYEITMGFIVVAFLIAGVIAGIGVIAFALRFALVGLTGN